MRYMCKRSTVVVMALCVVVSLSGAQCLQQSLPNGGLGQDQGNNAKDVLLSIVNESGVAASANITFFIDDVEVRTTTRYFSASGVESSELVVPTMTDRIHVYAHEVSSSTPNQQTGTVLADADIAVDESVSPGDTLTFIIHASGWEDCNGNNIDDAEDLANETSADCNANDIPDECDIANGDSADCNRNNIPDECETEQSVAVIYAENDRISSTDQYGATPNTIANLFTSSLGTCGKIAPDPANGVLYFSGRGASTNDDTLHRIALTGGSATPLINMLEELQGVAVDAAANKLYWSAYSSSPTGSYIGTANLDGSNAGDVINSLTGTLLQIVTDPNNSHLYFAQHISAGADAIQRVNADGTNNTGAVTGLADVRDIDVFAEADLLVWADHGVSGGVYTSRLDGSEMIKIADVASVTGVAIDRANCRIYWCGVGGGTNTGFIERAEFDGQNRQTILGGLDAPVDVAVYTN